jgi:hypothetical protein
MLRSVGLFGAVALVLHGCMGQPACTDSGEDVLLIPVARLASVTGLRADGTCTVGTAPADCSVATRCLQWEGEEVAAVTVTGTARGKCTVSVDFNDGCAAEAHFYEFIGPYENCCGDVCRKPLGAHAVASSCAK